MTRWADGISCSECGKLIYCVRPSPAGRLPGRCEPCRRAVRAKQRSAAPSSKRKGPRVVSCAVCGRPFSTISGSAVACPPPSKCRTIYRRRYVRQHLRRSEGREAARGYVYAVVASQSGWIKIGFSADTLRRKRGRMMHLQNGNPERLALVCEMPADAEVERRLHEIGELVSVRGEGEWFRYRPALLEALLKECAQRGGWASPEVQSGPWYAHSVPRSWVDADD